MSTPGIFKRLKKKMGRAKGGYEVSRSDSPDSTKVILNKFQKAPTNYPEFETNLISRGDMSLRAGSQFGRSLDQFDRARNSNINGSVGRQERVPIAVSVPVPPPLDNTPINGKHGLSNSVEDIDEEVASLNLYDSIDNLHCKTLPKGTKFNQPPYSHEEVGVNRTTPIKCASPITRTTESSTNELDGQLDNNNFLLEQKKQEQEKENQKKELQATTEPQPGVKGYSTLDELQIEIDDVKDETMKSGSENSETTPGQDSQDSQDSADSQNPPSFNELGARPKTSTSSSFSDVTSSRGSESPPFPPPPPNLLPVEDEFNININHVNGLDEVDHHDVNLSKSVDSYPFSSQNSHLIDRQCSYRSESSMSTSEEYTGAPSSFPPHPSDFDDNHPLNRKVYRETSEHRIEDIGEISSSVEDLYARVPRSASRSLDLCENENENEEDKTISSEGNVEDDLDTSDMLEGNETSDDIEDEDAFPPPPIPIRNYRGGEKESSLITSKTTEHAEGKKKKVPTATLR